MLLTKLFTTAVIVIFLSLIWWWLMKDNAFHFKRILFILSIPLIVPLSLWFLLNIWLSSLNIVKHRKQY